MNCTGVATEQSTPTTEGGCWPTGTGTSTAWKTCSLGRPISWSPARSPTRVSFYDRFDHVVLLSAPTEVILERVTRRTNPYGRTAKQRAEILGYLETVEPLLRRTATLELDGCRPVAELAATIEGLLRRDPDHS